MFYYCHDYLGGETLKNVNFYFIYCTYFIYAPSSRCVDESNYYV